MYNSITILLLMDIKIIYTFSKRLIKPKKTILQLTKNYLNDEKSIIFQTIYDRKKVLKKEIIKRKNILCLPIIPTKTDYMDTETNKV